MPTENEVKFVMDVDSESKIYDAHGARDTVHLLKQGYLAFAKGMTLRVRSAQRIELLPSGEVRTFGKIKRKLCFKQKVNERVIEIEKKIDTRDFEELWNICLNRIEKHRHTLHFGKAKWEVDFFKYHHEQTYFALAEFEMPEGQSEPKYIPAIIERYLLYSVPRHQDYEFSTKKLACVKHARDLYKQITCCGEPDFSSNHRKKK